MFRQHIACHHQGARVVLAKVTLKHAHARGVRGVAAYHGSVCAMYSVRVSRALHGKHALNTCRPNFAEVSCTT